MSEAQEIAQLHWDTADRLRKALRFADVSVQEMADHLGLSRNSIGRYINGHIAPDLRTLRLWSMHCGVPLDWLQHGDDERSAPQRSLSGADLARHLDPATDTQAILALRKRITTSHALTGQVGR